MSNKPEIPSLLVLSSLNPIEQNGVLISPRLHGRVQEYEPYAPAMWEEFLQAEPDSLLEQSKAKTLAEFYLLKTSDYLQGTPRDPSLWTRRFNQAGEEIYGGINCAEIAKIAVIEIAELGGEGADNFVIDTYKKIGSAIVGAEHDTSFEQLDSFKTVVLDRYSDVSEIIKSLPAGPYAPEAVRQLFGQVLGLMSNNDASWLEWKITNTVGNTMLNIVPEKKEIDIPDGRQSVDTKDELLEFVLHELGGHAQRAVNGYKTSDVMMYKGLPMYLDFEEGFGVLLEYLVTGKSPDKIRDRYVGTALATGAVDGYFLNRQELTDFTFRRQKSRELVRGKAFDVDRGMQVAKNDVKRIFRGGNGRPILDDVGSITAQAVYSKDIVYYTGFIKAKKYILEQLADGVDPSRLLDFLQAGKFDATNPLHVEYISTVHGISL